MSFIQFTASERRGVFILCLVLFVAVLVIWLVPRESKPSSPRTSAQSGKETKGIIYAQPEREVETFTFDPNTADSTTLLRLGLPPFMVRGIYRYRAKGGVYREPADFSHVPGLTNEMWERLSPFVSIDRRFQAVKPVPRSNQLITVSEQLPAPSVRAARDTSRFTPKLHAGETVELNSSDTSALKRIPGIGSYYSRQIVRYRQQLGGFVQLSQVHEIEGIPDGIDQFLTLDASQLSKIEINSASKSTLLKHPYINSFQAQSILEYRHARGSIKSVDDLRQLMYFSDHDIQRLAPYLDFK